MASADFLALMLRLTVATTLALAIVLVLRRPLRHAFGPNVAYAVWVLVPTMMLAAAFSRVAPQGAAAPTAVSFVPAPMATLDAAGPAATFDPAATLVGAWAIGMALWLSLRVIAQWHWRRRIGALRHVGDGTAYASSDASLPAAVAWPRAIVVLPEDFESRFPEAERALVLAHERRHVERGDLHAQVLAELVRALLWFHPLAHWAAVRFRHDQELACDADVIANRPADSALYARALAGASGLRLPPVATAWGFSHPLKERIAMLQHPLRSAARRRVGLALVVLMLMLASGLAWASLTRASAPPEGKLRQTWTFTIDGGEKIGPFLLVDAPGVPVTIDFENAGEPWRLESTVVALPESRFDVAATLTRSGEVVAQPRLVIGVDGGSIAVGQNVVVGTSSGDLQIFEGIRASVLVESGEGTAVAATVPRYPAGLAEDGVEGIVILRVAVSAEGRATEVRVEKSSGHVTLDDAAMARVREWRFTPATKDGAPVAGEVLVPVEFRADDELAAGE
jgi:TonB family protein